jgi:hypothetical protein
MKYLINPQTKGRQTMDIAIESTLGNGAAGFVSLVLFVGAWILNNVLDQKKWSAFLVLPIALTASFVLYASTWSATWCRWIGNILGGVGGMFGVDDMPLSFIFSLACVVAVVVVAADLSIDPRDNPAAVWSLFIAPVTAHGAGGVVGSAADAFFSGMALGLIDAVKQLTGA